MSNDQQGGAEKADYPYDEATVQAIVARLAASKHRVHQGAANIVAEEFLPDGRVHRARIIAREKGWPLEAILEGMRLGQAPSFQHVEVNHA